MVNDPATAGSSAPEEQRAELEAVLASASFSRAPAISRLLAYLCEQYLAGKGEFLKEYTIGTEALGRGANFDPDHDSVVRVMATRLRRRLATYYADEGAGHKLRIQLPESGYSPKFLPHAVTENGVPENAPSPSAAVIDDLPPVADAPPSRWRGSLALIVVLVLAFGAIVAAAVFRQGSSPELPHARLESGVAAAAVSAPGEEVLVDVGADADYRDVDGRVWRADRYCTGGIVRNSPERRILRAADPEPYRSGREGTFSCDIPVQPGIHEVHLHFAEIVVGDKEVDISGDGWRRFNVMLNGRKVLNDFDIIRDAAGYNIADERVLLDVEPGSDGFLHFRFEGAPHPALINGIEILRGTPHKMLPLRILAGGGPHYAKSGVLWRPDRYFLGGNALKHTLEVFQAEDPGICKTERWGHFNYAIPVADGLYKLTLRFVERHFGTVDFSGNKNPGGAGSRVFDIFCNGEALVRNFDVFRQAGGGRKEAIQRFRRLKPNAQGKLIVSFVPVSDYAMLNAIEVEPEDGRQ